MPRVRALTSWADRKAGEEFDASDADARVLCAADLPGGQKARLVDRSMKAAEPEPEPDELPAAPSAPSSTKQADNKRRYLRRDLRAQT